MKRSILGAAALVTATLLTTLVPGRANADTVAYATAVGGNLYSVDLTTATATLIGSTGVNLMEGLALSPGGALFGTDDSGTLYSINATTGVATSIGSTGLGDVEGLSFNGSRLIGSDFTLGATSLFTIDTSTAAATLLVTTSPPVPVIRALTFTNTTTALVANGSFGTETLSSINLTTGASAVLGAFNPSSEFVVAIAAKPGGGPVYGLDSLGNEYTIASNGNLTLVGSTGNHFYLDMTIAPNAVPEPSTCILAGMAVAFGLGGAWLRRRRSA